MSCPAAVDVITPGPPGVGLPSGVGFAGYAIVKDGNTPYQYKLVGLEEVGLPQSLGITASPTFAGLTLSGFAAGFTGIVTSSTDGQLARIAIGSGLSVVNGALVASGSAGTNLSYDATTRVLSSSTGDDVSLPLSTASSAGLQSPADKAKLDSVATVALTGSYNDLTNKPNLSLKADLVGGVVPTAQIPAIAISEYLGAVSSQSAMLALTGQRGDWCLRTDSGSVGQWILSGDDASILGNWVQIPVPVVPVQSVNGQTGIIVLSASDVGAVSTSDARLTDAREWFATTVPQAEAEEGSSTTRRAWTAQRVRQAIAAWWTSITSSLGRSLVAAATQADARNAIGAGTSNLALGTSAPLGLAATASAGSATTAAPLDHQHQRDITSIPFALSGSSADPIGSSTTVIESLPMPWPGTIISVSLYCETVVTTAPVIHNATLNGVSIYSTKPQVNVGATTTSNTPAFSITTFNAGDVFRTYLDQANGGGRMFKAIYTVRRS